MAAVLAQVQFHRGPLGRGDRPFQHPELGSQVEIRVIEGDAVSGLMVVALEARMLTRTSVSGRAAARPAAAAILLATDCRLNPHSLAKYRQAFHPSSAKSDPGDCALAADFAIAHPEQLHPWRPQDPVTAQLILETEQRRHLVDQRTVLANRLKAHLKGYFPQALDWLQQDLTVPWASLFLLRWPTL